MSDEIYISLESIGDDATISPTEGLELLSEEEKRRAFAFKFDVHRNRYIRGRAFLRKKLSLLTDIPANKLSIESEHRGKPYLPGSSIAFNLSHTGDVAIYAFSRTLSRLGIDIELISRDSDIEGLSDHYFTSGECEVLRSLPAAEKKKMFFLIWTAKEARMKLSGEGLFLDPRSIDLHFKNGQPCGYMKPAPDHLALEIREFPGYEAVSSIVADKVFAMRDLA